MMLFHSASETSRVGVRFVVPAQFTRISTEPNSAMVAASKCFDAGAIGDVARDSERFAAGGFDFGGGGFDEFGAAAGGDDVRAGFGKAFGECETDAGSAADDDGGFVGEIEWSVGHFSFGLKIK